MNIKDRLERYLDNSRRLGYRDGFGEKIFELYLNRADDEVLDYLKTFFDDLKIEVAGMCEGNVFGLMDDGLLEGWCYQTSIAVSLFLEDAFVKRGDLKFSDDELYSHSWVVFNYKGNDYIFDPCLQIICLEDKFNDVFDVDLQGCVSSNEIREYFIDYIENYPEEDDNEIKSSFKKYLKSMGVEIKDEISILGGNDPDEPMYRNNTGYRPEIVDGKIKKLTAHYYAGE